MMSISRMTVLSIGATGSIGAPKRNTREDILKYMDGSGEMYLGYHFQFLDAAEKETSILSSISQSGGF